MNVAFCWDWDNEIQQLVTWEDGLAAALRIIRQSITVDCYTQAKVTAATIIPHPYFPFHVYPTWQEMAAVIRERNYDAYLFFADLTRPALIAMAGEKPTALCFTGGWADSSAKHKIALYFVESQVYVDKFRRDGCNVVQAFGTNTKLFRPLHKNQKHFDAIFPATFADWKRHELFAEALGSKGLACGWFQDHEPWCYDACFKKGVVTLPHVPAYILPFFYDMAHSVVITSNSAGGSQRTVLEAMAMNIPCVVMADSDKTTEYVRESGVGYIVEPTVDAIRDAIERIKHNGDTGGRSYVLKKWSEQHYANVLLSGINSLF